MSTSAVANSFIPYLWCIYGVFTVYLWRIYGVFMAHLWRICVVFMVYLWRIYGVFVAYDLKSNINCIQRQGQTPIPPSDNLRYASDRNTNIQVQ